MDRQTLSSFHQRHYRPAGSTLVLVTHDENIARRCSRVLRLHEGQLLEEARPRAVSA